MASRERRPLHRRALGWAAVLAAALSLAPALVPSPATADGASGTLVFEGSLMFKGNPVAGEEIVVVAGPDLGNLVVCGRATSEANGHYSVAIEPTRNCTDEGNDGGPVAYIFTWKGQRIGLASTHYRAESARAEPIILPLNILIPSELYGPGDVPLSYDARTLLVPRRYYGTVLVQGFRVLRGLSIVIKNEGYPCGRATAIDGEFVIDVDADEHCMSQRSGSGWKPVTLTFFVEGRKVWQTSIHLKYDLPFSLGRVAVTPEFHANWLVP